jgi:hypothetical protein
VPSAHGHRPSRASDSAHGPSQCPVTAVRGRAAQARGGPAPPSPGRAAARAALRRHRRGRHRRGPPWPPQAVLQGRARRRPSSPGDQPWLPRARGRGCRPPGRAQFTKLDFDLTSGFPGLGRRLAPGPGAPAALPRRPGPGRLGPSGCGTGSLCSEAHWQAGRPGPRARGGPNPSEARFRGRGGAPRQGHPQAPSQPDQGRLPGQNTKSINAWIRSLPLRPGVRWSGLGRWPHTHRDRRLGAAQAGKENWFGSVHFRDVKLFFIKNDELESKFNSKLV